MKKKVLVIGLVDSIHLARWLKQFDEDEIEFFIFASKKFRNVNVLTKNLIDFNSNSLYKFLSPTNSTFFAGYIDYLCFELLGKFCEKYSRVKFLAKILKKYTFDYIHAIEIQGAGYLLDSVNIDLYKNKKVIITNWGSDIFYFRKFLDHVERIQSILSRADFYSGECQRDYMLAREFGFKGEDLPCIPVAGGFEFAKHKNSFVETSQRRNILLKGYGGTFGRINLIIPLIPKILADFPHYEFHIYSVDDDVLSLIKKLPKETLSKIRVTTKRKPLPYAEMLVQFSKARIHIGVSESDGISTAFLESIISGAYPIQTDTSCANEWISKGIIGSVVKLDSSEVLNQLIEALTDDDLVNNASKINYEIARKFLEYEVVRSQARTFYK